LFPFDWFQLQVRDKLKRNSKEMKKGYYVKKDSVLEAVDAYVEAPFMLQRFKIN